MLSDKTIASSIKIPIAISSATREIILMVMPNITIMARPPRNEIGRPNATQKVYRQLKNRNRASAANNKPCQPFLSSRRIRSRTMVALSWVTVKCVPSGNIRFSDATKASIASNTFSVSSVVFLLIFSKPAGTPLSSIRSSFFSNRSTTLAISPSLISPPSGEFRITRSVNSAAVLRTLSKRIW